LNLPYADNYILRAYITMNSQYDPCLPHEISFQNPENSNCIITIPKKTNCPGLAIDLNPETNDYSSIAINENIESKISNLEKDTDLTIAIVMYDFLNLDTFQFELEFNPEQITFLEAFLDDPGNGMNNIMSENADTIGFRAVERISGILNITNSITGSNCENTPKISGPIAYLKFKITDDQIDGIYLNLNNVNFIDCNGINTSIKNFINASINGTCPPWDFNKDGMVNYADLNDLTDHWLIDEDCLEWDGKYNLSKNLEKSTDKQVIDYNDLIVFSKYWLQQTSCK